MRFVDKGDFPAPPAAKLGWPWKKNVSSVGSHTTDDYQLKISIVTPSFNQGQFIEETIRSVLLQSYSNFEYIIIDGGSSDNTLEILKRYAPWLTHWESQKDSGQADAIKKGFRIATGDIFAWLNSDDYYEPDAFQRIIQFFENKQRVVFTNGDVNLIDKNSKFIQRNFALPPSKFFASNFGKHGWPQPGCFWRSSTYEQVGGIDPELKFCMDKDLFIRLVSNGPAKRLPGPPIANFRIHESAKSSTIVPIAQQETEFIIQKYGQKKWASRPTLMNALWWMFRKHAAFRKKVVQITNFEY